MPTQAGKKPLPKYTSLPARDLPGKNHTKQKLIFFLFSAASNSPLAFHWQSDTNYKSPPVACKSHPLHMKGLSHSAFNSVRQ